MKVLEDFNQNCILVLYVLYSFRLFKNVIKELLYFSVEVKNIEKFDAKYFFTMLILMMYIKFYQYKEQNLNCFMLQFFLCIFYKGKGGRKVPLITIL